MCVFFTSEAEYEKEYGYPGPTDRNTEWCWRMELLDPNQATPVVSFPTLPGTVNGCSSAEWDGILSGVRIVSCFYGVLRDIILPNAGVALRGIVEIHHQHRDGANSR